MSETMDPIEYPELIFATAGPIGVDMDTILSTLKSSLAEVNYRTESIKLSKQMEQVRSRVGARPSDSLKLYHWKIDYANALRKKFNRPDVLARIGLEAIRTKRIELGHSRSTPFQKPRICLAN